MAAAQCNRPLLGENDVFAAFMPGLMGFATKQPSD
jgi:hypothetical protein